MNDSEDKVLILKEKLFELKKILIYSRVKVLSQPE